LTTPETGDVAGNADPADAAPCPTVTIQSVDGSAAARRPQYDLEVDRLFASIVPEGCRVLEVGCGSGRLLAALRPAYGLGVDLDAEKISAARELFADRPELHFQVGPAEEMASLAAEAGEPFDYILLRGLLPAVHDVDAVLTQLRPFCAPHTRVVVSIRSNLWRPLLRVGGLLTGRRPAGNYNWLSTQDIRNLLYMAGFEVIRQEGRTLLPVWIPGLNWVFNRFLAKAPGINQLCLTWGLIARPAPSGAVAEGPEAPSVSIIVPTRNEKGNIEGAFTRTPQMGRWTELVFVDGNSDDGTVEEIERCTREHGSKWHRVVSLAQSGKGKGQAVRQAFSEARGDILMILDSDLTVPPEELPKFYYTLAAGRGEFINGSRLVYPVEQQAMRFLNMIANVFFARLFTWLLGQPTTDTLCGTKVLWRRDYDAIARNRSYFGEFDPFGDFDLLFGAARLNRKIVNLPIHYAARTYGEIKIERWRHGLLLLRMALIGFRRFKLS
jgi:SAM-dependent methyltransferase